MNETPTDEPSAATPNDGRRKPRTLKRVGAGLLAVVVVAIGTLFVWPSRIDPVAYEPPVARPLEGPLAPNDRLQSAELLAVEQVLGPEDVDVDEHGSIFTGTEDGRVVRVDADGSITTIATTGGRPLGIARAPDGNLIVADAVRGLLAIGPGGKISTLVPSDGDLRLGFTDDVVVARDGTIYFSDASDKFGHDEYLLDMLEGRPHGRLLRYDPATGETTVLIDGLHFANGVAISADEDFLLVNETYRFRIHRYWLSGERAGQSDIFIDKLPGYPDNITSNGRGDFWLAMITVRNDRADWLSPQPLAKSILAKLPAFLWPKPQPYALVVKLDDQGNVVDSFHDPSGAHLHAVTSAFEHDGHLYLGSLLNDRIGKYELP